ncbi:BCCT family transporter [Georgenia sp. H159]|uniref:BCCT family transporter n=1 Tax=Georgenia sp. H159 TaxID=3076115 RepID=UPI002D78642F|nr:BCCT family transporter [Georgenia sp. H159]
MATSPDVPRTSDAQPEPQATTDRRWYQSVHGPVFWPSLILILAFVALAVIGGDGVGAVIGDIQQGVVSGFGWYYTALVSAFVVFALWMGLSHYGDIRLSGDDAKPEFGLGSWLTMLFAAGMGIGLVFWGVAEPLHHFAGIPNRASRIVAPDAQGAQESLVVTFLHWGLHPWAIYVVVGLAIAYAVHVKNRPISIRWAVAPVLGKRTNGWLGDLIDIAAVVGTVFGIATSLGLGVTQIAGGLEFLEIISEPSNMMLVLIIGGVTALALASVISGVTKGIKWLSNINMSMAVALMIFVLITGPTLFLLREFIQGTGAYLQNLISLSFRTSALFDADGVEWQGWWTAFYWGWWISWAPFVGVFIARISKGRTVREFVLGVLLVPTAFSLLWFTVLGGAGLYRELFGDGGLVGTGADGVATVDETNTLFMLLQDLPAGGLLVGIAIIIVVLFFVTSSDSGSLVVDMLASGGDIDPPKWSRVLWAVLEGAVAAALVLAGGLVALRGVAITIALPFSVVMILMCVSLLRQFRVERQQTLDAELRLRRDLFTEHVTQTLQNESVVGGTDDTGTRVAQGWLKRRRQG